ncbi:MAG: autotransporter domain-containing protein [Duodenibacillus massiliensis]
MNKSFKVVFSKARSALMVVNEATSSVQAKGTKTVIAAAAAAMIAGGAMAAATNYDSVTINEGSSIVYTGAAGSTTTTQILGTTATGVANNAADKKPAAIADKTEVGTITNLVFSGGSVVVNASNGNAAAVVKDTVDMGTSATQIAGNISVNAYQGAGKNASLTLQNIGLKSGTIDFGIVAQDATNDKTAAANVTTGTATLSAGTVTLGATSDNVGNVGSQVVVKTVAGTDATITATGAGTSAAPSMNLVNVAVENAGKLTVSATNGDVVVGKDSTFVNTGVLTVNSTASSNGKVDFAADYDGKTGILNIGANTVNITGNITGDYVKIGKLIEVGADGKVTPTTDKNTIGISGANITIGKATSANSSVTKTGSLIVGNTLEIAGGFTNKTTVEAPATEVTAATVVTVNNDQYGTMALGDLTIKEAKGLTLTNSNTSGAVTVGKLLLDGTLMVSSGALEINGTGSKIGKGLLTIADAGVTLKGDLTNEAGTDKGITFTGTNAKLTIAGSLDNTKTGVIGKDATSGSIVVTGTLTNKNTVGAKDIAVSGKLSNLKNTAATEGYTGKITAGTVTVKEGGVVESALATGEYAVTETVVNKGGTFITALNSQITAENDSLTLHGKFSLDGGVLGTAADTPVTKFNLSSSDTLTLNGDYTLDTVKEATGAKFNVGTDATKTGNVTVKTLTAAGANSVVVNGTLAVTDSLTAATAGSVQVASGTLATSLKAMNLEANATTGDVAAITGKTRSAVADFLTLSQDAVLDLDVGGTKVSQTGAATIVGLAGTPAGLIDLGAVELYKSASEAVKVTNGEIAATELAGFDNITTDTLKASRILGKDRIDKTSSYGAVELSTDAPTDATALASAAGLTISDNVTLTLNGMGETAVNLVQYKNDKVAAVTFDGAASKLVTKGNGVIGEVKGDTTKGVLEVADKGLTVEGNVVAKDVIVGTTGTLTMGTVADATKAYTVNVANLTVDGTFAAAQNTVTIGTSIEVDGTATIKTLDISAASKAAVEGTLTVDTLKATTDMIMKVGRFDSATNKDAAGTVSVANFSTAGTIDATRAYTDKDAWTAPAASVAVKTAVAGALIKADENAYIAVGTTDTTAAQKALTAAGYTLAKTVDTDTTDKVEVNSIDARTVNTVVYVDGGKTATTNAVAFGGSINTTDTTHDSTHAGTGVTIAANTALAFDTATIDTTGTTALFAQNLHIADGAVVAANNLKIGDKILLTAGNLTADITWEDNVEFKGDILSHADVTDKVLSVAMYDKADLKKGYGLDSGVAGFDASYSYFANANRGAATTTSAQFAEWLYTKSSSAAYVAYSDGDKDVNVEAIRAIANAAGALGATTGVQTMTMDAVNQMGETVQDRVSVLTQRAAGVNVWAAANGGNFQAKTLYDGAGYKSDIYSGVLGVDYQFACNAVLGAALTVGTADTDSKNTAFGTSTDSDLVGFSVYTSKTFADIIGVSADIGYLSASNDVTANGYGFGYKFSEDTDAFTVGIRGEVLTQAGPVKIVPHIGLRYTALSTDSFEAAYVTDVDDQAIFQMPVGVTVSGDFQTGDWTVAPKFDLSVVPTFGDKDAEMKLGVTGGTVTSDYGVRVIDSNPVQATLGVNATNGAWGFGLNYKLGVGSDDRMNNTFNVNVRYAF